MSSQENLRVRMTEEREKKSATAELQILVWDKKERLARALKYGGMCFGAAVVSVLLPILHFILVPLFLLATPFVFMFFMGIEKVVTGGQGPCPQCSEPVTIARARLNFPISDICTKCQTRLTLVPLTES